VCHGRPYHPQTQGKDERFHRTLAAEVLQGQSFADVAMCQRRFDGWRSVYNHERPHEALGLAVPASRYRPSRRAYPEALPPLEYDSGDLVRQVDANGRLMFRGRPWKVGKPFRGQAVGLRPTVEDGIWAVYFGVHPIGSVNLRTDPDQR
jgi:Integrase core domain